MALFPRSADAQASDSVVFHRGQWGAEFSIVNGFFGVGALRFSSPTRALLMNISTDYSHRSGSGTAPSTTGTGVALDLGMRAHHSFGRRLYRLTTFGVFLGYGRQTISTNNTKAETIGVGPFADLGATWLVTPHLGIGARWRASISYTHATVTDASTSATANQVQISLGHIQLAGQLYF
jgi:hypothetical protein